MKEEVYGIKLTADITDFEKKVKKIKTEVKQIEEKMPKVKINDSAISKNFDFKDKFKNLGLDELNKKLKTAQEQISGLFDKAYKTDYNEINGKMEIIPQGTQQQLDAYKAKMQEIADLKDLIQEKTPKAEINEDTKQQVEEAKELSMTVGQVKQRIIELSAYKQKLEGQKILTVEEKQNLEKTNAQLQKYISLLEKIGVAVPKIKSVTTETENIEKGMEGISGKSSGVGINLSNSFTKATKSLKRFALSLFGIRSIWAMLSKGVRSYMNQNEKMQNTMTGIWNAFGTLMAPIAEKLANVFLQLLGYINVVTKALWGFDFIAKANANTMEAYNKKLAKTQKALSGIDEIQNINQNEQEGPQGLIDESQIKLNDKLVKKLQDLSYWLKDNWNWLKLVAEALGLAFGVSVIAGWVKNIGKLLGVAGSTGAGGTGLLGLASTLGWIAGLGVIAVEIAIAYKYGKNLIETDQNYVESSQDLSNQQKKTTKTVIELTKQGYKKGTVEHERMIGALKEEISTNALIIKDNQDKLTSYNLIDGTIAQITGKYQEQIDAIEKAENNIDELIDAYKAQYEQGNLTAEQEQYYIELLNIKNQTIKKTGTVYSTFTKNYEGLTEKNIQKTVDFSNGIYNVETAMVRGASTGAGALASTGIVIDDIKNRAIIMGSAIAGAVSGPYTITINSVLNPPDTSTFINALNDVIRRLNLNDVARMIVTGSAIGGLTTMALNRIPYLSVGTDLVKNEGLAYLHAGEQVVPADVVGGGYSGDSGETNSLLRELIETVQRKNFNATISSDDVGKASVNYIRNQNRIMGGSVI